MFMPSRRPPSFATLQAFALAARRRQFQSAAHVLGVTPSAISHHVRKLEVWTGQPLFQRSVREVRLTAFGDMFAEQLNRGFDIVAEALATAQQSAANSNLIRISALPLFTSVWLVPRLASFEVSHPGITVAVNTENRLMDLEQDPFDVAIRNITVPPPGLVARKLVDLHAVVLAKPDIAAKIRTPVDLAGTVLIHVSAGTKGWAEWLAMVDQGDLVPTGNLHVDTLPMALEAAVLGHGVVLATAPFVHDAPQARGLVPVFPKIRHSAGSFFVVHRKLEHPNSHVTSFVDWLITEMRKDAPRLRCQHLHP